MIRLKLICLSFSLLWSFNQMQAQSYMIVGVDPSGDCTCSCMDAFEIYYAYDIPQDSVWFLVISHYAMPVDYGYNIAIDMDDTTTNGDSWTGASSGTCMGLMDFNMNHDRVITVWPTFSFIEAFNGSGGNIVTYDVNKTVIDATTIKISTKLSYIDENMDGVFKLIGGFGQDNYRIHDVMPDVGFYSTGSTGVQEMENDLVFSISPNPVNETMTIHLNGSLESIEKISIYDCYGKTIQLPNETISKEISVNTYAFAQGIYFVTIESGNKTFTRKFIK